MPQRGCTCPGLTWPSRARSTKARSSPSTRRSRAKSAPISVFHAHAFDATNVIFDAIEKVALKDAAGNLYIPRSALKDAIFATKDFQGITGALTCNSDGDCANAKISVVQVKSGKYVRIWP